MDKISYPNDGSLNDVLGANGTSNSSLNDVLEANGTLNGSLNDNLETSGTSNGSLNSNIAEQIDPYDLINTRKKNNLNAIKKDQEKTVEALSSSLSISKRTIYRDIEWLKENNYLERIGSKRSGHWNVLKELK